MGGVRLWPVGESRTEVSILESGSRRRVVGGGCGMVGMAEGEGRISLAVVRLLEQFVRRDLKVF